MFSLAKLLIVTPRGQIVATKEPVDEPALEMAVEADKPTEFHCVEIALKHATKDPRADRLEVSNIIKQRFDRFSIP